MFEHATLGVSFLDPYAVDPLSWDLVPEDPPAPKLPVRLVHDVRDLVVSPRHMGRRQWKLLFGSLAAVGVARVLDDQIHDSLQNAGGRSGESLARGFRPLGQEGGLALAGAGLLLGHTLNRPRLTAVSSDALEATVLSAGLLTPILKLGAGRERPRAGLGSNAFGQHGESFPSGEVTQAFAMASVIAAHSRHRWVDALAYGAAGAVGLERIRLNAHWTSDVVAGALIGSAVGHWVVRRNRKAWSVREGLIQGDPSAAPGARAWEAHALPDHQVAWMIGGGPLTGERGFAFDVTLDF